jgi:diguanylate cyclase (GGDEF)-like protein
VLALSLIACITLGGGYALWDLVRRQADHAGIINAAGAQRMLSHRIAATLALAVSEGDAARRAELLGQAEAALRRMRDSHRALTDGLEAPARATQALTAHYFGDPSALASRVELFLANATSLLAAEAAGEAPAVARDALVAEALGPLLDGLHQAVALHEAAAGAEVREVLALHEKLVLLALALLAAEALLIFRPLAWAAAGTASRLEEEARRDALTGLPNRRAFDDALAAVSRTRPAALVLIDLDWFKETNDLEGHDAGDALLRSAGGRLRAQLGPDGLAARIGEDEFGILLHGLTGEAAEVMAGRLRDALCRPVPHAGRALRLRASFGVAAAPEDGPGGEALLRAAEAALLRAKREARGGIGRASPADAARLRREAAILRAFEAAGAGPLPGLAAHLQPIVSLTGGSGEGVLGFEALARWDHPELGPLSPAEFVPLAQRVGRAGWLDRQVRRSAFGVLARLREAGLPAPRVSVNLSLAEMLDGQAVTALAASLDFAGLCFDAITVEITEEVLLDRVDPGVVESLAALRELGARLALDDFGTGHSGLSHLLRLPIDTLKLDRAFIRDLGGDRRSQEIVRATVAMAEGLGMTVVAEGVETERQAAMARALGCVAAQGFLFARPMPEAELATWLAERRAVRRGVLPARA